MRNHFLILQTTIILLCLSFVTFGQTTCHDFNGFTDGWQSFNASVSVGTGYPRADGTRFLKGLDDASAPGSGGSWLYSTDFNASLVGCSATICYDYKVFKDGESNSSPQMINQVRIYSGSLSSPTLSATFRLNTPITEKSKWLNVCAPIHPITGNQLPSNAQGHWVISGGNPADWNTLIATFSGVSFSTDVAFSSALTEKIGIDNFCLTNNGPAAPVAAFHFEDANGNPKTTFTCNDQVFMDGTASEREASYFIDLWRRPIGGTAFSYAAGLGWTSGSISGPLNLTQLFAQNNYTIEEGYEYEVKLAVANSCNGWVPITHRFTMQPVAISSDFTYTITCSRNGTISVTVTATDPNPSQQWELFETNLAGSTSGSNTIGQVAGPFGGTSYTFTGLSRLKTYYIKHGVWNNCSTWRETRKALPQTVAWPGLTSNFVINGSSDFNGNVTVNTLADNNIVTVNHWWRIFTDAATQNPVPGNAIQCCQNNAATFSTNLQVGVWYYIKHGIWNDCYGWAETRKAIRIQQSAKSAGGKLNIEVRDIKEPLKEAEFNTMQSRIQLGTIGGEELNLKQNQKEESSKFAAPITDSEDRVMLFPNPIQKGNTITITTVNRAMIQQVEILNTQGEVQATYQFSDVDHAKIKPSNLEKNTLYMIRVTTTLGEILTSRALLK